MNNTYIVKSPDEFLNLNYMTESITKLGLSLLFSFIISIEREMHSHPGGAATHQLVATASCLFTMISVRISDKYNVETADPARICAQIVSGMGFLGAGTIYKSNNYIKGINTAANLWISAALGMAIGADLWEFAAVTSIVTFMILILNACYKKIRYKKEKKYIEEDSPINAPYNDGENIELEIICKED